MLSSKSQSLVSIESWSQTNNLWLSVARTRAFAWNEIVIVTKNNLMLACLLRRYDTSRDERCKHYWIQLVYRSLHPAIARSYWFSYCIQLLQSGYCNPAIAIQLLHSALAFSYCIQLLHPAIASSYCIQPLHPAIASSYCIQLLHPALASSSCIQLLHPTLASSSCILLLRPALASSYSIQLFHPAIASSYFLHSALSQYAKSLHRGTKALNQSTEPDE